jgi:putative NIF3 family GTP cyclohydrolase 1 type 2
MKLSRLYSQIVRFGKVYDPRGKAKVSHYEDTAILYGNPNTDIKKVMVGIDIEVGELMLADSVRKSQGLDLVIAHHPEGRAWAKFYEVMRLQVDMLVRVGLKREVAEQLVDERMQEVARRVSPHNHMRSQDAARILDMPFMCVHTPADNHAYNFVQSLLNKKKPKRLLDILEILKGIPEYEEAANNLSGPEILLGNPNRSAGKVFVEMTGGTEGPRDVFDKIYKRGVRTLVCMHLSEEHFKKVKEANLNVVIAGHISSDNLGLNLLLDNIEKEEKFVTISCSGFRRIRR